jgi:hypothetical protein
MIAIIILGICTFASLVLLVVFVSGLGANIASRVPYVPTRRTDIDMLVERVGITPSDTFVDLGSGNGRVVFAVERATGARVRGYEYPSWMLWYAKLKKRFTGSRAEFIAGNFFKKPWAGATIVYCYLLPQLMPRIIAKVRAELPAGTTVVSRDFPIPDLGLIEEWKTPSEHTFYIYKV